MKFRRSLAAVPALGAALVSVLALTPATSALASGPVWTGYLDVAHGTTVFNRVTADVKIPSIVACTSVNSKASFWIGIWGGNAVEQVGIATDCTNSLHNIRAWYEQVPAAGGAKYQFTAFPGDSIAMAVSYDNSTKKYDLALTDLSRPSPSTKFNVSLPCPPGVNANCKNLNAGAILEASNGTNLSQFSTTSLTEFQAVTDTGAVTGFQANGAAWGLAKTLMVGANGQPLADLSAITNNGENFSLTYKQPR